MISYSCINYIAIFIFFFQAEDGIRDSSVTGVQTCALPISACTAGLHLDRRPPPPNAASKMVKMFIFLEEFDPFRQLCWRAEGGSGGEKKLDSRVLLALRQCPPLAGRAPQPATSRSPSPRLPHPSPSPPPPKR